MQHKKDINFTAKKYKDQKRLEKGLIWSEPYMNRLAVSYLLQNNNNNNNNNIYLTAIGLSPGGRMSKGPKCKTK